MDAERVETGPVSDATDREIIITRIVDAPPELVWEAFSDPNALAQWWGPNGFTLTTKTFDFSEGGDWIFMMHGPDGRDYPNHIHFTEIVKPLRMVHDHGGDEGKVMFQAVITLDVMGNRTRITMRSIFNSKEARDLVVKEYGAIEGGKQTLARLDNYLKETHPIG